MVGRSRVVVVVVVRAMLRTRGSAKSSVRMRTPPTRALFAGAVAAGAVGTVTTRSTKV